MTSTLDSGGMPSVELTTAILIVAPHEVQQLVIPLTRRYSPDLAIRVPAHFTVLYPFVAYNQLDTAYTTLCKICAGVEPFEITLVGYDRFPLTAFVKPANPEPIRELFREIYAEFPDCPPYGGKFGTDLHPHMTVAEFQSEADLQAATLPIFAPITFRADRVHVVFGSDQYALPWITHSVIRLGQTES